MDAGLYNFIIGTATIVGGIISLKIFFSLWGMLDRKWNPGKIDTTPETAFNDLKNKTIRTKLKDGSIIDNAKHIKSLYFNDGEMTMNAVVYFQLAKPDKTLMFISGADISLIDEIA